MHTNIYTHIHTHKWLLITEVLLYLYATSSFVVPNYLVSSCSITSNIGLSYFIFSLPHSCLLPKNSQLSRGYIYWCLLLKYSFFFSSAILLPPSTFLSSGSAPFWKLKSVSNLAQNKVVMYLSVIHLFFLSESSSKKFFLFWYNKVVIYHLLFS